MKEIDEKSHGKHQQKLTINTPWKANKHILINNQGNIKQSARR